MQTITINVKEKIASTTFDEVVSFNNVYRLQFDLDAEWDEFEQRSAVVLWAGGYAEKLFTGSSCDMPQIDSADAETVLVGAYGVKGEMRIASSFVLLRCRAGAHTMPLARTSVSLAEQILSFLTEKDWSIFEEKVAGGIYSAVRVNPFGLVTGGWSILEVGEEGQTEPSAKLADGGLFFRLSEGIYTPYYYKDGALVPLSLSAGGGFGGHTLTVGEKRYDGSADVEISAEDLGLADVATSGSYNDLTDKPSFSSAVTSVNSKTGDVVLSAKDLGLADVATSGSYNDLTDKPEFTSAVTSVNGKTGKVVLSKSDVGLGSVPNTDTTNASNITKGTLNSLRLSGSAVKAGKNVSVSHSAETGEFTVSAEDAPVSSVNGLTGKVVISKNDLGLAKVAISGSYGDLVDAPDFNAPVTSVNGQTGNVVISKNDLGLADVAISGSYNDLTDKPSFSSAVTSVNSKTGAVVISKNDLGLGNVKNVDTTNASNISQGTLNSLRLSETAVKAGKNVSVSHSAETGEFTVSADDAPVTSVNGLTGKVVISKNDLGLAKVAISGAYRDLIGAPDPDSFVTSVNGQTGKVVISKNDLGLADVAISGSYEDLTDKPSLDALVTSVNGQHGDIVISKNDLGLPRAALTGSYNDLTDQPDLSSLVTSVNGQHGAVVISKNDLGLADVAISGSYTDLTDTPDLSDVVTSVNGLHGAVVISKNDLGLAEVALSGKYSDLIDAPDLSDAVTSVNGQTGEVVISKNDLGLADVALSGKYSDLIGAPDPSAAVTSVNGKTGEVVISKNDLGLAKVAISGSYNDLSDIPASGVLSVNGQTGRVVISKNDLGLSRVTNDRQMPLSVGYELGTDFDTLSQTGFVRLRGSSTFPCANAPTSKSNPSGADCDWFLLVVSMEDGSDVVTQVAFSVRADCSIRMRNCSNHVWSAWRQIAT